MTDGRYFDMADVLTITTGRLLSPRHMDGVYDILNHMTGDNLFTHQLPRACDYCKEPLLRQHPDLHGIKVPAISGREDAELFIAQMKTLHGEVRWVVPVSGWDQQNPIEELCDMVGPEKVYVVNTDTPS